MEGPRVAEIARDGSAESAEHAFHLSIARDITRAESVNKRILGLESRTLVFAQKQSIRSRAHQPRKSRAN